MKSVTGIRGLLFVGLTCFALCEIGGMQLQIHYHNPPLINSKKRNSLGE